jgi:hypothetical protein
VLRIRRSRGGDRERRGGGEVTMGAGGSRGFLVARRDGSGSGFQIWGCC